MAKTRAEYIDERNKLQGTLAIEKRNAELAKQDGDLNAALRWDKAALATQATINNIDGIISDPGNFSDVPTGPSVGLIGGPTQTVIPPVSKKPDDDTPPVKNTPVNNTGTPATVPATDNTTTVPPPQTQNNNGTTVSGKSNQGDSADNTTLGQAPQSLESIGRLFNPLGSLSSYTYQISLYMVNGDAYNAYSVNGPRAMINNDGVRLVAQSGGINNNNSQIGIKRAEGFNYDFYIDNLKFQTLSPVRTAGPTNTVDFDFTITEPVGFSFTEILTRASRDIQKNSNISLAPRPNSNRVALDQQYIIAIRFYGYDAGGNLIPNKDYQFADTTDNLDQAAVFERYYPIYMLGMNFTLNGKIITYNMKAVGYNHQQALSNARGIVREAATISGNTLREALAGENNSLVVALNQAQKKDKKVKFPDVYKINFLDPSIGDTPFTQPTGPNFTRVQQSTAKTSNQATVASAAKNKAIKTKSVTTSITPGGIISIIDQIIRSSEYVKASLDKRVSEDETGTVSTNQSAQPLRWFVIIPSVRILTDQYDPERRSYALEITYNIAPYQIPYIKAQYASNTVSYYGPVKRYDYWFTGKNTEILTYEQKYNNLYFIAAVALDGDTQETNPREFSNAGTYNYGKPAVASAVGDQNKGGVLVGQVATSLYSPADQVSASIQILGDPDYLDQSLEGSETSIKTSSTTGNTAKQLALASFYGRNFTISGNSGQVFIEIGFKEGRDYNESAIDGLKTINSSIKLWDYPPSVAAIAKNRIIYQVISVSSTFSNGRFTQDLQLIAANFPADPQKNQNATKSAPKNSSQPKTQPQQPKKARVKVSQTASQDQGFPLTVVEPPVNVSSGASGFGITVDPKTGKRVTVDDDGFRPKPKNANPETLEQVKQRLANVQQVDTGRTARNNGPIFTSAARG